ncbi:glutamate 2,3-aminomutase [Anaeromicrobium sediminis]|uniref:Glutamate 2,3-aminomutase n=2 Tax=Anaeromicrobium sediminis TaxID=1478221 RepID=A0A267MGI6_9FIRM|nr:glutamate 2,3-aminomutase [Anaeromicrobium sediminis]
MTTAKRLVSLERAAELKGRITDYLEAKKYITRGLDIEDKIQARRDNILKHFNGTMEDWKNHKWQLKNRISDIDTLSKFINLTEREVNDIKRVGEEFRWGLTPYYLSLIDPDDKYDPVRLLSIPTGTELVETDANADPMGEETTNPAGSITRRYPDRLIINVTNQCPMYCRHCQRRRNIGGVDEHRSREVIQESIDYIKENPEIRDVLITGGDSLCLTDETLEWILKSLREIDHVEVIRLGSRTPVTMPQRITDDLVNMIKKYHPVFLNTHFNHPQEITAESKEACAKLANAGIPLGNQAVLLNGINNDKFVMRTMNQELVKIRVRPYYIFHAKHVIGTAHFNTSIDDGLEIMEYLRGYTSGIAIPNYIVNAPNGNGKTPLLPQYLISRGKDYATIRTWEGKVFEYPNHPTKDIRELI